MKFSRKVTVLAAAVLMAGAGVVGFAAPAQAATRSVDVKGYCLSQFGAKYLVGTTVNPSNAYSWKCTYAGVPLPYGIDMNAACRFTTGRSYSYAGLSDSRNAYSWYCVY